MGACRKDRVIMRTFVDLGAYNGDTIEQFFNWGHLLGDPRDFKIYAFEPNPEHWSALKTLALQKGNMTISPKAAWTEDGTADFSVYGIGSTLMRSKNTWDKGNIIQVDCFDFSQWIRQFEKEFLIVKMDIEGSEFPILRKLIADKTIHYIDHLWVEMHPNKVSDYTTADKDELVAQLKSLTNFWEWH